MILYRIVKTRARAKDLSGTGSYRYGGRWNSKGTYMVYTSESSSLALLENLVHFDQEDFPPKLFLIELSLDDKSPIYILPDSDYPRNWTQPGIMRCKLIGDKLMKKGNYLALKVRSAVNSFEYNFLLNPLFPRFHDLVHINEISEINIDGRLIKK
jgi:RES domain-containing protein